MFIEGKVCVLKLNPVNAYLGPYLEEAFSDAIAQNFLAIVYGAADEGAYLVQHNEVDEVHLTGSDRTYEAIVWGTSEEERRQRRAERRPLVDKPVTAELGNVSPVIVIPGQYTEKELRYQAEEIAGAMALNAAFCCCTPRILVTAANWAQRGTFLDFLADALSRTPTRPAYYPGAFDKYRLATANRSQVRRIGAAGNNILPWTIVAGLDPWNASDPAFRVEYFCPVLFETSMGHAQRHADRPPRDAKRSGAVGRHRECDYVAQIWDHSGQCLSGDELCIRHAAMGRASWIDTNRHSERHRVRPQCPHAGRNRKSGDASSAHHFSQAILLPKPSNGDAAHAEIGRG